MESKYAHESNQASPNHIPTPNHLPPHRSVRCLPHASQIYLCILIPISSVNAIQKSAEIWFPHLPTVFVPCPIPIPVSVSIPINIDRSVDAFRPRTTALVHASSPCRSPLHTPAFSNRSASVPTARRRLRSILKIEVRAMSRAGRLVA